MNFKEQIQQGITSILPEKKTYDPSINHAPKRKEILSKEEKELALRNALRYFEPKHHATLLPEFSEELEKYGRIYMYRFRPDYKMYARPIAEYPGKCEWPNTRTSLSLTVEMARFSKTGRSIF